MLKVLRRAVIAALISVSSHAAGAFTARDQGNGEVLLEWTAQSNTVGYRVERAAQGIPKVSLDVGSHLNLMDFAGITSTYYYRLLARGTDNVEREVGRTIYNAPQYVLLRAGQAAGLRPQLRTGLGTNLADITYYSPQVPFVDLMKAAGSWISGDSSAWDNRQAIDVDVNGWVRSLAPGQIARTLMVVTERYPAGRYLVRYKGEGNLQFAGAASEVPGSKKPGELLVDVAAGGSGGVFMYITATNSANYLRDIEIIMPGGICEGSPFTHVAVAGDCGSRRFLSYSDYSASIVFYPMFLSRLQGFSVLRFMDWMKTNGSGAVPNPVTSWSQRTSTSYRTWAKDSGAPVEVMVALANKVGAHPWFNIPHASDAAYSQNFAQLIGALLDPALGVYVEHSNEVWNPTFRQYAYAVNQGANLVPPIDGMQYHALRSRTVGMEFKSKLGAKRAVAVLAAQAANSWTATHGLDFLSSRFGASGIGIDAVAIAPYFMVTPNLSTAATYASMTLDEFFDYVRGTILPMSTTAMLNYRGVAVRYGLRLISYEGGQHMVGTGGARDNAALVALFTEFNRDSRINQIYLDYLASWKGSGGQLFTHYTDVSRYDKWGAWGALEYVAQPRAIAPKFDALQTFIERNPVWWSQ